MSNSYETILQEAKLENYEIAFFPSRLPNYPLSKKISLRNLANGDDEEDLPPEQDNDANILQKPLHYYYRFINPFDIEIAKYPNDITMIGPIERGKHFDVISILSINSRDFLVRNNNDRVPIESLRGKYLLILCCFLPVPTESYAAKTCSDIIAAYSRLCVERPNEFEMVMVAKMRPNWINDEAAFNHFFSAFPCLAIPFWDTRSRDTVCKNIGCDDTWLVADTLVLDPEQKVLQYSFHGFFRDYGACAFPFTNERLMALNRETYEMMLRVNPPNHINGNDQINIPSLGEFLCLNPIDTLKKTNDDNQITTVFDLSKKLVVLYPCYDGEFLTTLNFFHQKCIAKGLELEIVLLYLPHNGDIIEWFQDRVNEALDEQKISWWVLPYNDAVSRRLYRFWCKTSDKVIILGADSTFIEPLGIEVMSRYGIKGYPFTREGIIDQRLAKLRALTLESVLTVSDEQNYVITKDGVRIPIASLLGRNVFLYILVFLAGSEKMFYDQFIYWYPEMKAKDPDLEIVFVDLNSDLNDDELFEFAFPLEAMNPENVIEKLFFKDDILFDLVHDYPFLIAFGKDGRIRSRCAEYYLDPRVEGLDAFPFQDRLAEEVHSFPVYL